MITEINPAEYRVLVVDDIEMNRDLLVRRISRQGYQTSVAADGVQTIETLMSRRIDLVLLDIMMPRMNGFEVLERMKEHDLWKHIPVIVVSAVDDQDSAVRCITIGADDYLTKPVNVTLLNARVRSCLERQAWRNQERLGERLMALSVLEVLLNFRFDSSRNIHPERIRSYGQLLVRQLLATRNMHGLDVDVNYVERFGVACGLHDIGELVVPGAMFGKLDKVVDVELAVKDLHPEYGGQVLRQIEERVSHGPWLVMSIEMADSHHELWDGSGYPHGLSGDEIPLSARILAVVDIYDRLTTKSADRKAFSHEKSCQIILEQSGIQFDPDVVEAFLAVKDQLVSIRERLQDSQQEK